MPNFIAVRSASGSVRKKSQFSASCSRSGGCGAILMALRPTWVLSFAGQTSTHIAHPVQSSGAIWMVNMVPGNSLNLASFDLKVAGAFSRRAGSYTFCRMVAWGQTKAHFPHWMQRSGSQTGISKADIAFFPLGGCCGVGAVTGHRTHGQAVTFTADDGPQNVFVQIQGLRRERSSRLGTCW